MQGVGEGGRGRGRGRCLKWKRKEEDEEEGDVWGGTREMSRRGCEGEGGGKRKGIRRERSTMGGRRKRWENSMEGRGKG